MKKINIAILDYCTSDIRIIKNLNVKSTLSEDVESALTNYGIDINSINWMAIDDNSTIQFGEEQEVDIDGFTDIIWDQNYIKIS